METRRDERRRACTLLQSRLPYRGFALNHTRPNRLAMRLCSTRTRPLPPASHGPWPLPSCDSRCPAPPAVHPSPHPRSNGPNPELHFLPLAPQDCLTWLLGLI